MVAFKGPHVILGLYKCNLTRGKELGAATGQKQGAGQNKVEGRTQPQGLVFATCALDLGESSSLQYLPTAIGSTGSERLFGSFSSACLSKPSVKAHMVLRAFVQ